MDLHHVRHGAGEPLLLIQGMSGTHVAWGEPFISELTGDFEVAAYDHRGIGLSPDAAQPFSIAELADDAAAVLDAVGWDSAHVMGISMGGMVAQELALRHGGRIRTLTLGCTYCGGPRASLAGPEVMQTLGAAMGSGDRERALQTGFRFNVSAAFAAREDAYGLFREMALSVPARLRTIMLQARAISEHDTSARLPEIDRPTLVIHGTEDQMLGADNGRLIAELIPGARLELMQGVGHMFWWEQPQPSARLVREHALAGAAA